MSDEIHSTRDAVVLAAGDARAKGEDDSRKELVIAVWTAGVASYRSKTPYELPVPGAALRVTLPGVYGRLTYLGLIYSFGSAKSDKQFDCDQSG